MRLSLQDKIALIYSLAGSQRKTAEFIGISHQKVGRILRTGQDGGFSKESKALSSPELIGAIDIAFEIHKQVAKQVARDHNIPFNSNIPIYYERKPFDNGVLGDRVVADHIHWVSDELKARFLASAQKTNKFANASFGSVVNWVIYRDKRESDFRRQQKRRTKQQIQNKATINNKIQKEIVTGKVYTPYTPMSNQIPTEYVINDIFTKLDQRHSTAAQGPNTALGKTLLLQIDTTKTKDGVSKDKQFRDKYPYKTKPRKSRSNSKR